jgi:hypothetical protein
MAMVIASEIENQFAELSPEAQRTLLERLRHRMNETLNQQDKTFASEMATMAADPNIQREIGIVDEEFRTADGDGLGKL